MFKPKTPELPSVLDNVIDDLLLAIKTSTTPQNESYAKMVDNLVKLEDIRNAQRPDRLSRDTIATVSANLAGILLILNHERAGVVTSKALSFITKLR